MVNPIFVEFRRRFEEQRLMRIIGVVIMDPSFKIVLKIKRIVPFINPDKIFFDPSDDAFCVGVAFGVVPGCKYLVDAG